VMFDLAASTVQDFSFGSTYVCVATGVPTPRIRWTARDTRTASQERISNNTEGISISVSVSQPNRVSSELTIQSISSFTSPTCVADNFVDDELVLRANDFTRLPPASTSPDGECPSHYLSSH
jgi:hypothetical protein